MIEKRLNPFVYISDTDIAFYLLISIGLITPFSYFLNIFISVYYIFSQFNLTLSRILSIASFFLMILFIYWIYLRFPKKIINESNLRDFDEKKFPDQHREIQEICKKYLPGIKPRLMYSPLNPSESAFTFGTSKQIYIGLEGGLLKKFRKDLDGFRTILFHEFSHISNKDITKTFIVTSTLRFIDFFSKIIAIFFVLSLIFYLFLFFQLLLLSFSSGIAFEWRNSISDFFFGFGTTMGIIIYFIIFLGIVYLLRNKIVRLREFYADAKVVEWNGSDEQIIRTLEESKGEEFSRFEILKQFHPSVKERIQYLKNNEGLFIPGLWIALSLGYFFGIFELTLPNIYKNFLLSSSDWAAIASGQYKTTEINLFFRAAASFLIIPFLIFAISSGFHKLALYETFNKNKKIISLNIVLYLIAFALLYSFGYHIEFLLGYIPISNREDINFWNDISILGTAFLIHAFIYLIVILYIMIFASILIQRSFNKDDANKNFIIVSIIGSLLYIVNKYYTIETLHNKPLIFGMFIIFSILTYTYIKINDNKLNCPVCHTMIGFKDSRQHCPNCNHDLYSWAYNELPNTQPL